MMPDDWLWMSHLQSSLKSHVTVYLTGSYLFRRVNETNAQPLFPRLPASGGVCQIAMFGISAFVMSQRAS